MDKYYASFEGPAEHQNMFTYMSRDFLNQTPGAHLIPYHEGLKDLQKSSSSCNLCRVIYHTITPTLSKLEAFEQTSAYSSDVLSYKLALSGQKNEQGMQVVGYREEEFTIHALLGAIGFAVDQESKLSDVLKRRKIPSSPQSKDGLELMQRWTLECTTQHGHQHVSKLLPTRLLKYDEWTGKVTLCSNVPADTTYAALSHCWGSVQPLTLNTNTAQQLHDGILIEAFPRTFQDAFWVTQKLRIPYLWIDSLCIIQDSNDDWVRESARMCDVYGNAYLTIAATKSKNSSEGFLRPRSEPFYTDITFMGGDAPVNVSVFPMPNSHVGAPHRIIDLDEDPLSTRCWAFQERYLSPRTLHFAKAQMYFECESCFEAQAGYTEPVDHPRPFNVPKREGREQDEKQIRVDWNFMVARYTQRYITMDSDKLPALGGLAARVSFEFAQQGSTCEYLAGLWKENLFCDLFWLALDHEPKRQDPRSYSAPSWSWASVNHPVHYHYHDESENLAILRDAKVNLENDESPFGKVTGGWIHLSAIMIHPCTVDERNRMFFLEQDSHLCIKVQWDPPNCRAALLGTEVE
ncbi:subtilisin-like serine protease [Fusarium pseudoanthophilum]|uniref:Subtilisin-like serine protease n=1 Tax=Fusarium pseudoanthophilum TaxID=48495 RepID=A0A8H5UVP7_9HYPO|nr:subtilisin-like serine protease [Fusarium pseudoanthophilum]